MGAGRDRTRRRIISSGHIDHLNSSCVSAQTFNYMKSRNKTPGKI